ncbi:hypothetical protein ACEYYA_09085 [Paracoccus sp. p3-h83]|uniref:hypothetical protein n=1 Tax=Paracoccus sp. p3-h83 TaxID=3342805 RepID=UPI0035B8BAF6
MSERATDLTGNVKMPVSRAELDAGLAHVMAAPKDGAAIEMLCLRPARGARRFVDSLRLTRAFGIDGDRWPKTPWLRLPDGRPHPAIQVSILQRRVLDLVWRDRDNVPHPGDSFIVDMDLSEANLPVGQHLALGTAVLEVSDVFNDGCVKWKTRYGIAAKDWITAPGHPQLRLRGVLCSIVRDGLIQEEDRLVKIRAGF